MKKCPVTVEELSKNLGLSSYTVSSVLNGKARERRISEKTISRVQNYVDKVGFHQDISALSMRGKYSKNLAIVTIDSYRYPAHGLILNAIESHTNAKEISSVMFSTYSRSAVGLNEVAQQIKIYNVEKVLIFATGLIRHSDLFGEFLRNVKSFLPDVKCYIYDCSDPLKDQDFIYARYRDKSKQYFMIEEIAVKNEYKRILALGGSGSFGEGYDFKDIKIDHVGESIDFVGFKGEYMVRDNIYAAHGELFARLVKDYNFKKKRTLIYIQDDFTSIGFLQKMREFGFDAPRDFGLISWDNMPLSRFMQISSLGYDYEQVINDIIKWINAENTPVGEGKIKITQNTAKSI